MKDLLLSKVKHFIREGTGYDAEIWFISLDRCFAMQEFDSNVKERYDITNLDAFSTMWWMIEEHKIGVDMSITSWELFL